MFGEAEARHCRADFPSLPAARAISFGQNMTSLCYSLSHALAREPQPEGGGVLRAGFSMYNTADEVDRLLAAVADVARRPD